MSFMASHWSVTGLFVRELVHFMLITTKTPKLCISDPWQVESTTDRYILLIKANIVDVIISTDRLNTKFQVIQQHVAQIPPQNEGIWFVIAC